jgi:hypothetical protein
MGTALAVMFLAGFAQQGQAQQGQAQDKPPAGRTLKAKLNYTGAGTVDDKHKIYVFVFDSPDFIQRQDAMPIAFGSTAAKDGLVTMADLSTSPVYLIAVYDPSGAYEGMSKPPTGASLAIYGKNPGEPGPIAIEAGKTIQVDVPLDDSFKMP